MGILYQDYWNHRRGCKKAFTFQKGSSKITNHANALLWSTLVYCCMGYLKDLSIFKKVISG
jgi:hypothetical protein